MAIKILVTGRLPKAALDALNETFEVHYAPNIKGEDLEEALREVEGLIIRTETKVTEDLLKKAPNLKLICRAGVGLDNVDLKACAARHIEVKNTSGANCVSAAEHTMGLILSLARMIPQANTHLRSGNWDRDRFTGTELRGKTLGIIGFGNIGSRVSSLAQAFSMKVIANDIVPKKDTLLLNLPDLLGASDFVTMHVPLTAETHGMANKNFFSKMKEGSFFINASRGKVVVEKDLVDAIESSHLKGAALDVFFNEPLHKTSEILKTDKIILTPHTAGQTIESQNNMGLEASRIMKEFLCPES